jgi:hypothetical protein
MAQSPLPAGIERRTRPEVRGDAVLSPQTKDCRKINSSEIEYSSLNSKKYSAFFRSGHKNKNRCKYAIYSDFLFYSLSSGGETGITVEHLIPILNFLDKIK